MNCTATLSHCRCGEADDGHTTHVCPCGGSWQDTPDGVEIRTMPDGYPTDLAGLIEAVDNALLRYSTLVGRKDPD